MLNTSAHKCTGPHNACGGQDIFWEVSSHLLPCLRQGLSCVVLCTILQASWPSRFQATLLSLCFILWQKCQDYGCAQMCLLSLPEFWKLNSDLQVYVTSAFIHQGTLSAWEFCLKNRIVVHM